MDAAAARRADAAWGVAEPLPDPWRHGAWELERRGDELADIRFDGSLLLRSVRAVARDRDWSTLTTEVVEAVAAGDELRLVLRMTGSGGDLAGELVLHASEHGLTARLRLTSGTAFARNRIGLVVLHPPRLAGSALEVMTDAGVVTGTAFPDAIGPHQPAMDIAALAWTADGVEARLAFAGDVFEMEDQRNWTDASFKTYSTPLALPFPVELEAGAEIVQELALAATRVAPRAAASASDVIELSEGGRLPEFGLGVSTAPDPVAPRATGAAFLLVELETGQANWRSAWERAVAEADGLPLDVRIVAPGTDGDVGAVAEAVRTVAAAGTPIARIGVFSPLTQVTEPELWTALRSSVAGAGLDAALVGGARSHFTELNRRHGRLPPDVPALAFSSTPQMHARERAQLVEAIPMQTLTARDAVRIAHGRPVHIGPVTLRSRYNAVATTPPPPEGPDLRDGYGAQHVPEATDPRQGSEAAAAWLVASAAAFSVEGVATVSWFETTGPRGLRGSDGTAFPVEAAFTAIAELSGREALRAGVTPDGIHVLAGRTRAGPVALLANLAPADRDVTVRLDDASVAVTVPSLGIARVAL